MKASLFGLIDFSICMFLVSACGGSQRSTNVLAEQQSPSTIIGYFGQALGRLADRLGGYSEYEFRVESNSMYGAFLASGESQSVTEWFYGGVEYLILGIGDEDVLDLDLFLVDQYGNAVARDVGTNNRPIVRYTPAVDQALAVRIRNYRSTAPAFCLYAIAYRSGRPADVDKLREAAIYSVVTAAVLDNVASGNVGFPGSSICLWGGYYSQGRMASITGFRPNASGAYIVIGIGSSNVEDTDVSISREYGGGEETLCEDSEVARLGVCSHFLNSSGSYSLRCKNYSSLGKGYVLGLLLVKSK